MFHAHVNAALLLGKMNVILKCYIHSQSVPHLQVDLPPEIVEQLKSKRFGPYVFREAQVYYVERHAVRDCNSAE